MHFTNLTTKPFNIYKNFIIIFISIFIFSCSSSKTILNVTNLKDINETKNTGYIYALAKTVVTVDLKVIKKTQKRGLFYQYAEEFLDIKNVIKEDKSEWEIVDVSFNSYPVIDSNHYYHIESKKISSAIFLNLTDDGRIVSLNTIHNTTNKNLFNQTLDINYDLNRKKNKTIKNNLNCNDKYTNSNFTYVPILKKHLLKRTTREKANEIANQILSLRDDKAAMIVGDGYAEAMPDGKSLEIMIKEIDKMEKQYLSMFIGNRNIKTYTYHYEFTPEIKNRVIQKIICRFSPKTGIMSNKNVKGNPIILEITKVGNNKVIHKFKTKQQYFRLINNVRKKNTGIYYRVPEKSIVKILNNDKVIAKNKLIICQLGETMSLPISFFKYSNFSIEFYPEFGAIKRISNKESGN